MDVQWLIALRKSQIYSFKSSSTQIEVKSKKRRKSWDFSSIENSEWTHWERAWKSGNVFTLRGDNNRLILFRWMPLAGRQVTWFGENGSRIFVYIFHGTSGVPYLSFQGTKQDVTSSRIICPTPVTPLLLLDSLAPRDWLIFSSKSTVQWSNKMQISAALKCLLPSLFKR